MALRVLVALAAWAGAGACASFLSDALVGDAVEDAVFGITLASHGDAVLVGAPSIYVQPRRAVYLYKCAAAGAACALQARIDPPPEIDVARLYFGSALAVDARTIAVGMLSTSHWSGADNGILVLYSYDTASTPTWTCRLELIVRSLSRDNFPGYVISLKGNAVIAGAMQQLHVLHCAMPTDAPWTCTWAFNLTQSTESFSTYRHAFDADGRHLVVESAYEPVARQSYTDRGRSHVYECAWADDVGTPSNCTLLTSFPVVPADDPTPSSVVSNGYASVAWPLVATPTTARIGSTSLYSHAVVLYDCSDARASSTCTHVQTLPAGQGTLGTGNFLATRARPTLEGVAVLAGIPDDGATDTSEFVVGSVHVFACVQNASAPAGWACRPTQELTAPEEIAGTGVRPLALGLQLALTDDAVLAGACLSGVEGTSQQGSVLRFPFEVVGAGEVRFPCASATWDPATCMECLPGHYGDRCLACDVCNEHGTCEEGVGGGCACDAGWAGPACAECAAGWAGPACDVCAAGYYGAACAPCTVCDAHGTCRDGLDGNCTCDLGWAGDVCTVCAAGWTGAACDTCAAGHFGASCAPCTRCVYGTCTEGRNGSCACDPGYGGAFCEGELCALAANTWRAQVLVGANSSVLAEDLLSFDTGAPGSFAQNLTAYPFQSCTQNWIAWTGTYTKPDVGAVVFSYVRCTPGGAGCLVCGTTRVDTAALRYAADCSSMVLDFEASGEAVTYFAVTPSRTRTDAG